MIIRIPTSTDATLSDYDQRVVLDGQEYGLRFRYNERSGYWYLDLTDADGVALVSGRKLVRGARVLGRSGDPRLPPGRLMVVGLGDPGLEELGAGGLASLVYVDEATVAAALAAETTEAAVADPETGGGGVSPPSDL